MTDTFRSLGEIASPILERLTVLKNPTPRPDQTPPLQPKPDPQPIEKERA